MARDFECLEGIPNSSPLQHPAPPSSASVGKPADLIPGMGSPLRARDDRLGVELDVRARSHAEGGQEQGAEEVPEGRSRSRMKQHRMRDGAKPLLTRERSRHGSQLSIACTAYDAVQMQGQSSVGLVEDKAYEGDRERAS